MALFKTKIHNKLITQLNLLLKITINISEDRIYLSSNLYRNNITFWTLENSHALGGL
jgi:hypothetical protein